MGAGPESRVGLLLDRSVDLVVGILGVLKAGAAYVPLDPASPRERLAFVQEDADIRIVVGAEEIERLESLPDGDLALSGDASSLAYVIYTSGSTGRPKGTLITHANVTRLFDATDGWFGFGEQRRLDAVPLLRLRLLGLGDLGRPALRRPAGDRALGGQPLARALPGPAGPRAGNRAQPDPFGLRPARAGRRRIYPWSLRSDW